MSFVVDASVLVAALTDNGSQGAWAETLLATGPLYAPELVRVETTNVLRRLESAGHISRHEANAAFEDLCQLELELFPFEPLAERIWELRHNLTSYDAWYVALAEALDLPLATLDERLASATGPGCEIVMPRA